MATPVKRGKESVMGNEELASLAKEISERTSE